MQLLLIVASILIACIASLMQTTDATKNFPSNITWSGRILIILALASGAISIKLEREKQISEDIMASIALQDIETGLYSLLEIPIASFSDVPEMSLRFSVARSYFRAGAIQRLCSVDISVPFKDSRWITQHIPHRTTWAGALFVSTHNGLEKLRDAQKTYGDVLTDRTNILIGRIVNHPWNELLLRSELRVNRWERRQARTELPLCSHGRVKERYLAQLDEYGGHVVELETLIGRRFCDLRRKHDINEIPPLFLRQISGLIFVPNKKGVKLAMDRACDSLQSPNSFLMDSP